MGIIKTLPKDVIERIAAGEVVERPASVVKELAENSIDAGAGSISIDIADGGLSRITVIDDGCGMDHDDLANCALRHATSKIRSEEDLWQVRTMGFRGEALAAIGAVCRVAIESKVSSNDVIEGGRIEIEGGVARGPVVAGCAGGTKIEVRDLFFNVPARRKFLRSAAVEAGHVLEAVSALALAYPGLRIEFNSDGTKKLFIAPCPEADERGLRERVVRILGDRYSKGLVNVGETSADIEVRGFVAESGRAGGKDVHFFLNRRPVKDRMLMHALTQAFGGRLAAGQSPAAVLWIEIDQTKVDVNVHPAKREVRFSNSGAVHDFIVCSVRKSLDRTGVAISSDGDGQAISRMRSDPIQMAGAGVADALMRFEQSRLGYDASQASKAWRAQGSHDVGMLQGQQRLRAIGQLGRTYIVCEDIDACLVIIDQHAAHERMGYDRMKSEYDAGSVRQQRLLMPEHIDLGSQAAYVLDKLELLEKAGFEIEPFGGTSIAVKSVPEVLGNAALRPLFEKLAHEFEELGSSSSIDDALDHVFAVTACHGQVRAGDGLSRSEIDELVRDVERLDVRSCPHGRPAIIRVEAAEIEKWFKRS